MLCIPVINFSVMSGWLSGYGKCSKISNTLKLPTPKIMPKIIFKTSLKTNTDLFLRSEFLKLRTQVMFGGISMSVYARFTYTIQRHLESSILLKWVIWHMTFFFACRVQDYTFCMLIVRFMLSDKIKGKSALKARTFLHDVRDKVHVCYRYRLSMHLSAENSAGYLQRVQIFLKPFVCEMFTYKKHSIHRNSSAMVINMDFLCHRHSTDRIRSYIYREKTPI